MLQYVCVFLVVSVGNTARMCLYLCGSDVINPRRACARVTVVVLCVCLCVCLSVCLFPL